MRIVSYITSNYVMLMELVGLFVLLRLLLSLAVVGGILRIAY